MKNNFLGFGLAILTCTGISAQVQQQDSIKTQILDEVVVSDSRFKLKRENSGKTVIKITAEELEKSQGKTIAEIINTKSGLEINGSRSRNGSVLGVFSRGGRGRQTLVIIDGIQVSDPSSFSSEYDFRLLSIANIASIEIIKGAASTLYGTNAATAVINITTKEASKKEISANFQSSIGTNQISDDQDYNISDFSNSVAINGTLDKFTYAVGISNTFSDNISAVITAENQEDSFSRFNTDVRFGYTFSDNFKLSIFGNRTQFTTEFDESFGFVDADNEIITEQLRAGLSAAYTYENGSIQANGAFSSYDTEVISAFGGISTSENIVLDVYNKYNFNNSFYTILGVNYIENSIALTEEQDFTIVDPYVNAVYVSDFGLNVNAGLRLNNHSEYGSNFIYNVNPSYSFKTKSGYLKLLASYATSYITPSLNQLFGAFGPNPDLEPEDDRTIEGGVEYSASKKLRANILYFNRSEENFVFFDNDRFGFFNAENTVNAEGVEFELNWLPTDAFRINANYTFTERTGDDAIRIPRHKVNLLLGYTFSERTNASLTYAYTGDRSDTDFNAFPSVQVPLDAFSLVDFYIAHELLPNKLKVFLNANNILNEDFQEVFGFSTRGRNFRIGLNLNF